MVLDYIVLIGMVILGHAHAHAQATSLPSPLVPAFFIFGDSLVDVGNNNYLITLAKADVPPYGIDFPGGATGRFSNGKTVLDVVCDLIGLPYVPAFLDPRTRNAGILKGVNYASGAGGILDESGRNYIQRISMSQQVQYFKRTLASLVQQLGDVGARRLVSESLFTVVMGNNDYINNYLLPDSPSRSRYTPQEFQQLVLSTYSKHLTELYTLGARRIVVSSMGPLGCIPSQLAQKSSSGACIESVNMLMRSFNVALEGMLATLNSMFADVHFVYADTYTPVANIIANPTAYGLDTINMGCCGGGRFNGQFPCFPRPISNMCSNRTSYLFWDPFHPTDAANILLGNGLYLSVKAAFGL